MHSNVNKLARWVLLLGVIGWFEMFGTALSAVTDCNAEDSNLGPLVAPNTEIVNRFISTQCVFSDKWDFSLDKAAQTAIGVQGVDFDFGFGNTQIDNLLFALLNQEGTEIANGDGGTSIIELLDPGAYTLQISGDVVGSIGGQYSGALTIANVPLPSAILLFVTGLSGFLLVSRRRPWRNAQNVPAS
jgi:hypothetical protein